MSTAIVTEQGIRLFMMDKPELNPLLDGVRWSAEEIEFAGITVVDYYNTISPPTGNSFTIENFPYRYLYLIGVCGMLLRGAAINQASNQLTYSADGVTVADNDKAEIFTQMGNQFWAEFKATAEQTKINENISGAFGSISSEYVLRAR